MAQMCKTPQSSFKADSNIQAKLFGFKIDIISDIFLKPGNMNRKIMFLHLDTGVVCHTLSGHYSFPMYCFSPKMATREN